MKRLGLAFISISLCSFLFGGISLLTGVVEFILLFTSIGLLTSVAVGYLS